MNKYYYDPSTIYNLKYQATYLVSMKEELDNMIKKTAHLDNLTLIGFNIFTLLNLALCWASVIQLMFP